MLSYLRRHWLLYLILTALAIALGLGASYVVGVIGSTPDSVREERAASEEDLRRLPGIGSAKAALLREKLRGL